MVCTADTIILYYSRCHKEHTVSLILFVINFQLFDESEILREQLTDMRDANTQLTHEVCTFTVYMGSHVTIM